MVRADVEEFLHTAICVSYHISSCPNILQGHNGIGIRLLCRFVHSGGNDGYNCL